MGFSARPKSRSWGRSAGPTDNPPLLSDGRGGHGCVCRSVMGRVGPKMPTGVRGKAQARFYGAKRLVVWLVG